MILKIFGENFEKSGKVQITVQKWRFFPISYNISPFKSEAVIFFRIFLKNIAFSSGKILRFGIY